MALGSSPSESHRVQCFMRVKLQSLYKRRWQKRQIALHHERRERCLHRLQSLRGTLANPKATGLSGDRLSYRIARLCVVPAQARELEGRGTQINCMAEDKERPPRRHGRITGSVERRLHRGDRADFGDDPLAVPVQHGAAVGIAQVRIEGGVSEPAENVRRAWL